MRLFSKIVRCGVSVACLLLIAAPVSAGEKKFMHCFYFSAVKDATEADWQAFFKATDELPGKIAGLNRVWYGKLARPFTVFSTDAETRNKLSAGEQASGPVTRTQREWAVCMEMNDATALKTYADSPAHKAWQAVYGKVRQEGTNTFDFMGQ